MKQKFTVFLVLFLMTVVQVGTDLYLPSLPDIQNALSTTSSLVQQSFSVFLAGFAVSQLIYGPLSDRFGRKLFINIGTAIFFMMAVVCIFAKSIEVLLAARLIQGLGAGACSVISRAITRDRFTGHDFEKVTLYQTLVWSFIPLSAPLLGSYIQHYLGWQYNFACLAIFGFAAFIITMLYKERFTPTETHLHIRGTLTAYKEMLSHKKYQCHLVCGMCIIGALAAYNVSAPIIIQDTLGLSAVQYGWSTFAVGMSFLVSVFINRYLINHFEGNRIASVGVIIIMFASVTLLTLSLLKTFNLFSLLIPLMIMQVGLAFLFPSNAARAMEIFSEKAGKAAAMFGCSIFLGGTAASYAMSMFSETTLLPLALVLLSLSLIMTAFHYRSFRFNLRSEH